MVFHGDEDSLLNSFVFMFLSKQFLALVVCFLNPYQKQFLALVNCFLNHVLPKHLTFYFTFIFHMQLHTRILKGLRTRMIQITLLWVLGLFPAWKFLLRNMFVTKKLSLQIFVGNLDPNVADDHLRQVFSQYGQLLHVKIPSGKRCGFVQFVDRQVNIPDICRDIFLNYIEHTFILLCVYVMHQKLC
jgi:hypothetical protein